MSDEEKKAIEDVKEMIELYKDGCLITTEDDFESLEILLNLIEKQSKEIEELKEDNKHQWEERCKLTFELENSTSNDKIKAKIEELERQEKEEPDAFLCKIVLQSLLEKE